MVPVVLYHAHMPGVSGGFVGVDVFFVISGFLITGILAADVAAGRFSIVTFYERRVRRIFPALFAMLAVSARRWRSWLLLPFELEDFAREPRGVGALRLELLLHGRDRLFRRRRRPASRCCTPGRWRSRSSSTSSSRSSSTPMSRWAPRWLLPVTVAVLVLSLALCIAIDPSAERRRPSSTRRRGSGSCWPGSVLALAPRRPRCPAGWRRRSAAAGLALIAVAVFGFDARTPFPGSAAILPVAGTALVILGDRAQPDRGRGAAVARAGPLRRADLLLALSLALAAAGLLPLLAGGAAGALGDRAGGRRPPSPRRRCPGGSSSGRSASGALLARRGRGSSPAGRWRWLAAVGFGQLVARRAGAARAGAARRSQALAAVPLRRGGLLAAATRCPGAGPA